MAQKKSYSRYFIILQEDEKGYALASDKLPTGYVKLELKNEKCKVSYYVQNLKKQATPYHMILILGKKDTNKIVRIGELNIDNYGRADVSYEYSPSNLADTGMNMENISGAAIVKFVDKDFTSVLSGFLTTDIPKWRDYEIIESKTRKEEIKAKKQSAEVVKKEKHTIKNEQKEKNVFDKYEDSIEEVKESIVKNERENSTLEEDKNRIYIEDKEETINHDQMEYNDVSESIDKDNLTEDDVEINVQDDIEFNLDNDYRKSNKCSKCNKYPKGSVGEFFKNISDGFEELDGDITEIKRCRWYKVNVSDIRDMYCINNYNKYTVVYYPMINYYPYIKSYGHYLIGFKCDKKGNMKYLVYAIPGSKCKSHQPFGGKSGFVTWVSNEKCDKNKNDGYWLMFYDFRTSTIVIPVK
ncbi:hypothetical protein [Clostridium rectalis]|uniref:DUF7922 domain-containing protein n=1 Tax=Clostridium rectalis TaxID=2040295 RepID=UPI000F63A21D|nr:hypothetical protein [Clostridium rectalis]